MSRSYDCFLTPAPKVDVVYVYPSIDSEKYSPNAVKYVSSYTRFSSGYPHNHIVVCNGGKNNTVGSLFGCLPEVKYALHDNSGYDIGAFQAMARQSHADLMVFFGASVWIRGEGWLERIVQSFRQFGPNHIYGTMGHQGNLTYGVFPHIRTTGFWLSPKLMNQYPLVINQSGQRYGFEHGKECLTQWVYKKGGRAIVVTWSGEYEFPNWDSIPNGFHNGNQSELLFGDRMTDPPYYHG